MPNGKSKYFFIPVLLIDIIILSISFFIAHNLFKSEILSLNHYKLSFTIAAFTWILIVLNRKIYDIPRFLRMDHIMMENVKALILYFLLINTLLLFFGIAISPKFYISMFLSFSFLQLAWHIAVLFQIKKMRIRGLNYRKVLLVGMNKNMEAMIKRIQSSPEVGYQISALFTNAAPNEFTKNLYQGRLEEVKSYCESNIIHHMIISLPHKQSAFINDLLHFGDNNLIRVKIIPEYSEYLSQSFYIDYVDLIPILKFRQEPLESLSNKLIKRSFDLIFSFFVILFICSWLFPVVAVFIKLSSDGPIFFVQERSGKRGKIFNCFKFRTMKINRESDLIQATKDDDRITPVGRFLRKTSLDEFPQFINVFKGDMSVVGPRPHMLKHTKMYSQLVNKFMVRHFAKPGITGWAQIKGFRGETKEVEDMKKRAEADIWYLENWNLLLDFKIIILTVWNIFSGKEENAF
ncbi:undecaprenyl-phosphate glucose phosphotransferase [Namhaeicola litoreus]|uniref:Undecaprenyl-phosphate glucose phosphotransferase n=1 Tax=Namhaeicola litoreus TaxID=1052145 RepID=A0ABW3Y5A0_9FLAO